MFGIRHKKHRGARNTGGVDIPITPMLDMTFQLLFFFIINYNPSPLEGQMDLTLPTDTEAMKKENVIPQERNPADPEEAPKDPPEVTVVVKTQHDGTNDGFVSSISLKTSAREVQVVGKDNKGLGPNLDELVDALKDLRENLEQQDRGETARRLTPEMEGNCAGARRFPLRRRLYQCGLRTTSRYERWRSSRRELFARCRVQRGSEEASYDRSIAMSQPRKPLRTGALPYLAVIGALAILCGYLAWQLYAKSSVGTPSIPDPSPIVEIEKRAETQNPESEPPFQVRGEGLLASGILVGSGGSCGAVPLMQLMDLVDGDIRDCWRSQPVPWHDMTADITKAAAALAGLGTQGGQAALLELALLQLGDTRKLWSLQESDSALPLTPHLLAAVRDGLPIAMLPDNKGKAKEERPNLNTLNDLEALAYDEAVYKASLTSVGAFANSARHDVAVAQLMNDPKRYRGEVIHFEGRLRMVRRYAAPIQIRGQGVSDIYECWVMDPNVGYRNPVCFIATELPPGVIVAEKLNHEVQFDGYFFKRYRYGSVDSKPGYARETPLFIGRSLTVLKPPSAPTTAAESWPVSLPVIFLGAVLLMFVLAFSLHLWYRRADQQVRRRLENARTPRFFEPNEEGTGTGAE